MPQDFRDVDPRELRRPSSRQGGADPFKLQLQIAMTPTIRAELIERLADLRELSPDVRFGQLLANLGLLVEDRTDRSLWEIDDAELLRVMEEHRADLLRRQQRPRQD